MKPGISEIHYKDMHFIIMDRPSDATLPQLLEHFKRANVKDVIRLCEPSYKTNLLNANGIIVHDWQFSDGSPPPQEIVEKWFELIQERHDEDPNVCFAVHCIAGLGRGPVMVALALMELGLKYEDTIDYIRDRRRGAFNQKQLKYLSTYKPRGKLRSKKNNGSCQII